MWLLYLSENGSRAAGGQCMAKPFVAFSDEGQMILLIINTSPSLLWPCFCRSVVEADKVLVVHEMAMGWYLVLGEVVCKIVGAELPVN
jgi:hypothetical protein